MEKKLYRSRNKVISGVCGGIAEYFFIDPTLIRLLWVAVALLGGTGVIAYIICAVVIPENPNHNSLKKDDKYYVDTKYSYDTNYKEYYESEGQQNDERNRILAGGILIVLGALFLAKRYFHWFDFDFIWPVLLIIGGIYIIYKNREGH